MISTVFVPLNLNRGVTMGNNVFRRAGLIIACAISITLMGPIASAKVSAPPAKKARPSDAIRFPVTKYKLPNGLTVLISEDHHSPLVSYQQWFRVGSSHEKVGHTGLAHFFEHMMFEGTKKYRIRRSSSTTSRTFLITFGLIIKLCMRSDSNLIANLTWSLGSVS